MSSAPTSADQGVVAKNADLARSAIESALAARGLSPRGTIDLRPLPFEGTWGVATSVLHGLSGEQAQSELEASGTLAGLTKKEARKVTSERARQIAQTLGESVVADLAANEAFASVEAANGFINIAFAPNVVATGLVAEVIANPDTYGNGPARSERVMVEHSQPNTHKVFHVGHLRNTALGVAVSNILAAAGYPVTQATYPGDIGMHVIKSLWCYQRFHQGEAPTDPLARGRWLGQIYAESDARLEYRKDVYSFLQMLAAEDVVFVEAVDRMLKELWRLEANPEDLAYLFGRITSKLEYADEDFRDPNTIPLFWPAIGAQLALEAENYVPELETDLDDQASMTPPERYAAWQDLNEHLDWWPDVPTWRQEVRDLFQLWEAQNPEFVALWQETREWSLEDFRRIFAELGANFDVWFFESEVDEEGKAIVQELLDQGVAEISDGAAVVKIDQKLGLDEEVYRTLPILRSDGTSLYSTKDLALTKRKFEDFGIDRAIWVVDVRQSLYFKQIFKILELWGFEQARDAYHLPYEIVTLPEGVISSRKGRAPLYDEVREQVLERARQIIDEKNPDLPDEAKDKVAWQVGIGSLKYAMLNRDNNKVVVFDLDEALSFDGHAAPYIQYAHARASNILQRANWTDADRAAIKESGLDFGSIRPEELDLLQEIAAFPEEVQRAADQYRPLLIANYAFELAQRFNDFYHACPVIHSEEPVRTARLALVDASRITLARALALLGIEAPAEM